MVSNGQVFFRTPEWMAARRLTTRVSVASNGDQANGSQVATLTFRANALFAKGGPSLSADGRFVAFASFATNLAAGDPGGLPNVYVHDPRSRATAER